MSVKTWKKFGDKIPDFLEPTSEEIVKAQELLGEDLPLFEKFRNGTLQEQQETRNELTVKNMGLVYRVVNRFYFLLNYRPTDFAIARDDLDQEGILGLMRAIETYDYTKGVRFSTYVFYWIRHFIQRCYQDKVLPVRIPVHLQEKLREITKITDSLRIKFEREPTRGEIAEAVGMSLGEFEKTIIRIRLLQQVLSLDALPGEGEDEEEISLAGIVAEPGKSFEEAIEKREFSLEFLKKLWKIFWLVGLNSREQYFLERFFGLDGVERATLQKIGDKQGITREGVRQIVDKALGKLRIPETVKIVKTILPESKIPEPTPFDFWRRTFELLKLILNQRKKGAEWIPESLIKVIASHYGFPIEELRKPWKRDGRIVGVTVFLLSRVCGMSKAQICSFLNVKERITEVSVTKLHEELKIWGKEALWLKFQFPKTKVIPEGSESQFSMILNLLEKTRATYSEIANLLNVSEKKVERVAQKAGINGRTRMWQRGQEKREKISEEILNHPEMTYDEITKLVGLKKRRVGMIAQELGIKRRKGYRASPEIASRNQKILVTAHQNPDLTYEEIGKMFNNLSGIQICFILQRQGFHRFRGWHTSRLEPHKIKPTTKRGLKAHHQKILKTIQNNPKLSYPQIGEMFGLSGLYVKEIAQQAGIFRRPPGSTKKREDITFERVFNLLDEKGELKTVAKMLNCSELLLRNRLREANQTETALSK